MALDSRWANRAAVGILDTSTATWSSFDVVDVSEPFNRRGFRGLTAVDDHTYYAVNSGALYRLRIDPDAPGRAVTVESVIRRPEWELGQRAAVDLHHVHFDRRRNALLLAVSAMDAIDEVSLDGELRSRTHLWDAAPWIADLARHRRTVPGVHDLVHVNHIATDEAWTYLTLCDLNGTKDGCIMRLETGEVVVDGLRLPHDGLLLDGDLYVTNADTRDVRVWRDATAMELHGRPADVTLPIEIRHDAFRGSGQWVRGIALTERYLVVGVTQFHSATPERPQIPPRLVFYERSDLTFAGEIFLPAVDGFPAPCIYTLHVLDDTDVEVPRTVWDLGRSAPPDPISVDASAIPVDQPTDLVLLLDEERRRTCQLAADLAVARAELDQLRSLVDGGAVVDPGQTFSET